MSDYNKLQLSTFILGDQLVIRTDTAEELKETVKGLAAEVSEITDAMNTFKEVYTTKGILTDTKPKHGGGSSAPAADTAPPGAGGVPNCDQHGKPMKDLSDRDYKFKYYCSVQKQGERGCNAKGPKN